MAIPTSVQGGSSHGASVLSSAEKIVAQHALAKLGVSADPAVKGVSTVKLPSLSGTDSIKVASQTASSIKAESATPKTSTSTLTLSDKTTVTLTGVSTHNVVKPH
jgi:hypothetical protein